MAALTKARRYQQMGQSPGPLPIPVKASTTLFEGGLVVYDAGFSAPGRTATGLIAAGVARKNWNNASGAAGAITSDVFPGIYKFANDGGDAVVAADRGKVCFITDDQTVCKTNGGATKSAAGIVIQVDSDGVFVYVHPGNRQT